MFTKLKINDKKLMFGNLVGNDWILLCVELVAERKSSFSLLPELLGF